MTIDIAKEHEIRRLHDVEKWKRGTIVAELGVHADVVDRALVLAPRPSLVDPYEPFIDETLKAHPRLRATRLFDMIRMRGYDGGIAILRRHVAEVRPVPRGEVYLRAERLIGEQAQVDWAHVGSQAVTGGTRPLWVFVMVLAYSRAMWAELVFDLTVESLRRSLVRAARFFDGVTRQWLFDNPKTVVLARHGDAVRYHPGLLEIAGALRVQPRLCRPRRPTDKGGVERANRYLHDRFFAARTITSIEDGNRQLLDFIRDIADVRPHPRFRDRTVAEVFAEEKERLLALPASLPETDLVAPASVDTTAFVRFGTNLYSVPPRYARATVTLVASDREVRILDGADVVARHERSWGKHQRVEDPEHRVADEEGNARRDEAARPIRLELPARHRPSSLRAAPLARLHRAWRERPSSRTERRRHEHPRPEPRSARARDRKVRLLLHRQRGARRPPQARVASGCRAAHEALHLAGRSHSR